MWKEGSLSVYGDIFHWWLKVYESPSKFGINGGKVSKMMLKRNGQIVMNYDRGWDIKPVDENTKLAMELLLHGENY